LATTAPTAAASSLSRRKLGQHFLIKGAILERIAAAACPAREPLVVEIGPGRGALTDKLLKRADRLVAIEIDPYLVEHLRNKFADETRLEIVQGDAAAVDFDAWRDAPVAGNLPYYAATAIIERTVRRRAPRAVFLVQKEVAERLAAGPGTRDYGYLSVATQLFADVRVLFDVKPGAFHPPPKVNSAVVLLEPRPEAPAAEDTASLLRFVGQCFRQKRKTIRNNLADAYGKDLVESWPEAGLRAEQIPIDELKDMYRRVIMTSRR
jgi:16S rRNA (adenine1518-N6/adenine1519-N6)-dimethyltransferase